VDDIAGYLRRIGWTGPVRPDAATLAGLHRAHLAAVPYENLDIQLGRPLSLDPAALHDKIVRRRRGGYCFELNGSFGLLLRALGFAARWAWAATVAREGERPGAERWGNHLVLLVAVDGTEWLVDVGFGDGFLEPLPLRPGSYRQGPFRYGVRREADGVWRLVHQPHGTVPGFEFGTAGRPLDGSAAWCERLSTSPGSPFTQKLVAQQPHADHVLVLRGRTLRRVTASGPVDRVLADRAEFEEVLRGEFGIQGDSGDIGANELGRLWRKVVAQHEAWVRDR
jgi:N-hydroxyarylamine O-acetyltransferase